MKNITVSVDDDTYRRARIWALQRNTSISEIVRCILVTLPTRGNSQPAPPNRINASAAEPETALIPIWGLQILRSIKQYEKNTPKSTPARPIQAKQARAPLT